MGNKHKIIQKIVSKTFLENGIKHAIVVLSDHNEIAVLEFHTGIDDPVITVITTSVKAVLNKITSEQEPPTEMMHYNKPTEN